MTVGPPAMVWRGLARLDCRHVPGWGSRPQHVWPPRPTCVLGTAHRGHKADGRHGEAGHANLHADEMTMLLSARTGRGRLRPRRARDGIDHLLQSLKVLELRAGTHCTWRRPAPPNPRCSRPFWRRSAESMAGGIRDRQRRVPQVAARPEMSGVGRRRRVPVWLI